MTIEKEKNKNAPGYLSIISLAGLIGIIGGLLFGIWDSFTVMIDRGIAFNSFREMFFLSLYAVAVYAVLGCLGMAIIGFFSSIIVKTGKYNVSKKQLARVFIGIFTLLSVSVILADLIIFGNMADILETTIIGIFCGVGTGVFSIYVLTYISGIKLNMKKLITLGISFFIPLLVFTYGGLFINIKLLSSEPFYHPLSLISNIGLFILIILLATGLYRLINSTLTKYSDNGVKWTGYTLISIMLCVFIVVSLVGPFNGDKVELISGDATGKPNILWIVMDTVRADHLSCYGYYRDTTPNIDRIASEGVLYENAISAGPWTVPSHASMFTGIFPSEHGTDAEHQWLDSDFTTIAELLSSQGYITYGYSNNWYVNSKTNLNQGFETFTFMNMGKYTFTEQEPVEHLKVSIYFKQLFNIILLADDGANRTNKVVKQWINEANKTEAPFFLFINYMEAHQPYHPPQDYVTQYLYGKEDINKIKNVNRNGVAYITEKVQMSEDDFRILNALYDGEISYLDLKIGQIFDYLKELKILDNTIVIITADHGENFGDHNLMGHYLCVYDTLIHVPLIIRYPENFETGLRIDRQVQHIDIFPTILDIIGITWDSERQIQGHSLVKDTNILTSPFTISEHAIWFDVLSKFRVANRDFDYTQFARRLKTVRTDEYKYIWSSDGRDELYNIRLDPEELNNLIDAEPEKAEEMKKTLFDWYDSIEPYRQKAGIQIE